MAAPVCGGTSLLGRQFAAAPVCGGTSLWRQGQARAIPPFAPLHITAHGLGGGGVLVRHNLRQAFGPLNRVALFAPAILAAGLASLGFRSAPV